MQFARKAPLCSAGTAPSMALTIAPAALWWQMELIERDAAAKGFAVAVVIASGVASRKVFARRGYSIGWSYRYADAVYQQNGPDGQPLQPPSKPFACITEPPECPVMWKSMSKAPQGK
jgi:hypothetical protein